MNKAKKLKAMAYSLNLFVLGLTGGALIPATFHSAIAWTSLAILLAMSAIDCIGSLAVPRKTGKVRKVNANKERPPRKRKRKKK